MSVLIPDWRQGRELDTCCRQKILCGAGLASFSGDADRHFRPLRRHLIAQLGFDEHDFLEMSYTGWRSPAGWTPRPYHVADVQGPIGRSAEAVAAELDWYRARLPEARFHLVGYSLGGVIAFAAAELALSRDLAGWRGRIVSVSMLSSPLRGVDFGLIQGLARDIAAGPEGYGQAGVELLERARDPETLGRLEVSASFLRAAGVRLLMVWDRNDSIVQRDDAVLPSGVAAREVVAVDAKPLADADQIARRYGHGPVLSDRRTLAALALVIGEQECPTGHARGPEAGGPTGTEQSSVDAELEAIKAEMRRKGDLR